MGLLQVVLDCIAKTGLNICDVRINIERLLLGLGLDGEDEHTDGESNVLGSVLESHGFLLSRGFIIIHEFYAKMRTWVSDFHFVPLREGLQLLDLAVLQGGLLVLDRSKLLAQRFGLSVQIIDLVLQGSVVDGSAGVEESVADGGGG